MSSLLQILRYDDHGIDIPDEFLIAGIDLRLAKGASQSKSPFFHAINR
jgi:hypothetical protein